MKRSSRFTAFVALAGVLCLAAQAEAYGVDPVGAKRGMVASTREIASRVGVEILRKGGNAADAAVAVAFALAVVWPAAGNLGGGGFVLVRSADGQSEVIDYRERAPLGATRTMYLDAQGKPITGPASPSVTGYRAVGVPGTVAGMTLLHKKHGKLNWAALVEPARKLAAEGFEVDKFLADSIREGAPRLADFEESRRIFLPISGTGPGAQNAKAAKASKTDGKAAPPEVGSRLVQPDLAATLARIQKNPRDFYVGETARRIVADMAAHNGVVTARDLAEYEPTVRAPLRATYRGFEILTMPPPSSGGILLVEMLGMLEKFDVASLGFHSAAELHLLIEVMKRAFADRGSLLGDADFVKVPVGGLTSPQYIEGRARDIDLAKATPSSKIAAGDPAPFEKPETTHFSVVDAAGNMVTNTYTLNGSFGSAVVAKGTGVLLNNEMDDFATAPGVPNMYGLIQGEANAIAPKKRPLSTMTPTIVVKDGKAWMALGSPGGPTIVNTVLQVIVDTIDFGMNLQEAVNASRIHHQHLPDQIMWEPWSLPVELKSALEARGHLFAPKPRYIGDAECVAIDPVTGLRLGASDPRLGGAAVGY